MTSTRLNRVILCPPDPREDTTRTVLEQAGLMWADRGGVRLWGLEDSDDLPNLDVLAQEIADDMQMALEQFSAVVEGVKGYGRQSKQR